MPSSVLYAMAAIADLLIAVGTAAKVAQALAYSRRLDAALWALIAVGAATLAIAYGVRAAVVA